MVLTIDIGTSIFKTALFNLDGQISSFSSEPISINSQSFFSSKIWIDALKKCCNNLDVSNKNIDLIIICGNGPTFVASETGESIMYFNRDATKESEYIKERTGLDIDPSFFLPKALYIKNAFLDMYNANKYFMSTPEYLSYILTGVARTVMPLEGLEKWYWNSQLLDELGLDKSKFPEFIEMGKMLGTTTESAFLNFGIKEGTPVLSGCPDFVASIIGSGVLENGQICDRTGSSEGINYCSSEYNDNKVLMCYRHPNNKSWNVSGVISTTGKAIEYVKNLIGFENLNYEEYFNLIEKNSSPGSNGVVFNPYLFGERTPLWNVKAKASFSGLTHAATRYDLARSSVEGVCFAIKHVMQTIGQPCKEIVCVGGSSESDFINQCKADITGSKVLIPECKHSSLLGLFILATSAEDLSCGAKKYVKLSKEFIPNESNSAIFDKLFCHYKENAIYC